MQAHYAVLYRLHAGTRAFARRRAQARQILTDTLARCSAPYVAFSGGKDSTALLLLLAEVGRLDIPIFTQADDLDWPEKRAHCHGVVQRLGFRDYTYAESTVSALAQFAALDFSEATEIRGTFSHVIQRYVRDRARDGVLLGLRAAESHGRSMTRRTQGPVWTSRRGFTRGLPLADWSGIDVFALILSSDCPYMALYDCDGFAPPHELRMSWLLNPLFVDRGAGQFLRRYFPAQWRRLADLNPRLRRIT